MEGNNIKVDSFNKLIIDNYIDKYNQTNAIQISDKGSMALFTARQSFSVLQFQPEEELCVNPDEGIFAKNKEDYIKKYNDFFDLSFKDTYALILTPEYSVPKESVEYLINNTEKIRPGALYCVCCEGMNYSEYLNLYSMFMDNINIEANNIIVKSIIPDKLVCVMFYIAKIRFVLSNREPLDVIFAVPQFKVNQMRDPSFDYETSGLTLGNSLLYFGDDNGPKFMSMICADSYNLDVIKCIQAFGDNDLLVFNPQLNLSATNNIFDLMRRNLFEYCKERIRLISLNWARNTKLLVNNTENKLQTPKSCYYFEFIKTEFQDILKIYPKNTYWGFEFGINKTIGFWETYPYQNVTAYYIDAFRMSANPRFTTKNRELKSNKMWIYEDKQFKVAEKTCKKGINAFFEENEEFDQILNCDGCTQTDCTKCKLNELSSSIFDNNLIEEYATIYDDSVRFNQFSDSTNEKIIICKKILYMIKNGLISSRFKTVDKKIKFIINKSHDLTYNIVFLDNDENFGKNDILCRIIFLKYTEKHLAINKYNSLVEKYGEEQKDNIMVFYESDEGCKIIPEFNSKDITDKSNPETSNKIN